MSNFQVAFMTFSISQEGSVTAFTLHQFMHSPKTENFTAVNVMLYCLNYKNALAVVCLH